MRVKNVKKGAKVLVIKGRYCGMTGVVNEFSISEKAALVSTDDNSLFCVPVNYLVSDHTIKLDNHKRMKGYKHEKKG